MNMFEAISGMPSERMTDPRDVQPWKMPFPSEVTVEGRVTEVSYVHPENAPLPIVVMPSEKVRVVSAVQSLNAFSAISSTVPGMLTEERAGHFSN